MLKKWGARIGGLRVSGCFNPEPDLDNANVGRYGIAFLVQESHTLGFLFFCTIGLNIVLYFPTDTLSLGKKRSGIKFTILFIKYRRFLQSAKKYKTTFKHWRQIKIR